MNKLILQAHDLFKSAGFDYAICGGYGLDMFAGRELRAHGDFDIMVFKEDKRRAVQFLADKGWTAFGRFMEENRMATLLLFYQIDNFADSYWDDCKNVWAVKPGQLPNVLHKLDRLRAHGDVYTYQTRKWLVEDVIEFIEFEFDAREDGDFVLRENPKITRPLDKAILHYQGIPYLAPEIILYYKSNKFSCEHPNVRPKTQGDFDAIMPMLSPDSKKWLLDAIDTTYPDGHSWLDGII